MKIRYLLAGLAMVAGSLHAQGLSVEAPWVRATVPGQQATGAFMKITAPQGARLIGVSTPVAPVAEIHEMRMDGDVMRMRAIDRLELPAGKTVELRPGSFHIMLMNLKVALKPDSTIPLTFTLVDAQGVQRQEQVQVPVRLTPPAQMPAGMPDHSMHMKN